MRVVIIVDGGAGRVISCIPALEHYVKEHPNDDIKIFVFGWDSLFWSNRTLQQKTFNALDKGTFEFIKTADIILSPEPYRLPSYINQKVSLSEAFDILINGKHNNLLSPKLYLSPLEIINARNTIQEITQQSGKQKTLVIQPFGSTAQLKIIDKEYILDPSNRSMTNQMYMSLIKELSSDHNIILFADKSLHLKEDDVSIKLEGDLRVYASLISSSDYFIGCDSVGQHMARSFNKPGTVIFGSTFPENVSYPDWFQIIDKAKESRVYSPLRINDSDCNFADRMNSECMNYSEHETQTTISLIRQHIDKTTR